MAVKADKAKEAAGAGRVELRHEDGRTVRVREMHLPVWAAAGFKRVAASEAPEAKER